MSQQDVAKDVDFQPLDEVIVHEGLLPAEVARSSPMSLSPDLAERDLEAALSQAENRVRFAKEIKVKSLRITEPSDWLDISGKPYLGGTGVNKLCWQWGIYWHDLKMEPTLEECRRQFKNNEPVSIEVTGVVGSKVLQTELVIYGGRSSDDEFFTARWEGKPGNRRKVNRPMSEVDVLDVRKAAFTNWEVRAVTTILGLGGLTWEELGRHGITPGAGRVEFRGRQQQSRPNPPLPPTPEAAPVTAAGSPGTPTVQEMRRQIADHYVINEKAPDKAINAETNGAIPTVEALDDAKDAYVSKLYGKLFAGAKS